MNKLAMNLALGLTGPSVLKCAAEVTHLDHGNAIRVTAAEWEVHSKLDDAILNSVVS